MKNKSQPEAAASGVGEWVVSEREMRERLKREKEEREVKEKLEVCSIGLIMVYLCLSYSLAGEEEEGTGRERG